MDHKTQSRSAVGESIHYQIRALSFANLFQGVCWMFYPAEDDPAYVDNSPTDQQYSVDWNQIQQSYQEVSHVDIGTGTWPLHPNTASSHLDTYQGVFQTAN